MSAVSKRRDAAADADAGSFRLLPPGAASDSPAAASALRIAEEYEFDCPCCVRDIREALAKMERTGYVLETPRLILRRIQRSDEAAIRAILQDPEVMYAWEHPFTDSEAADWMRDNLLRYDRDGFGYWAVLEKGSEKLVGVCGLLAEQAAGKKHTGVGYLFNRAYWGRGYAVESAGACVDYGFRVLQCSEITAQIRPENAASRKVAEKLGMKVKGRFIKRYRGKEMPHLLYSLAKQEAESPAECQNGGLG